MKLAHLAGMSARRFLREHWQKKPLLVREAFADFAGLISPDALFALACRDDAEARLVKRVRAGWSLSPGPFTLQRFAKAPKRGWTLLVQDVNHFVPEAAALLQKFAFVPHARVDDVMVSYAAPGGGVGPHFDSYDVFLLQGPGKRRWQISSQTDRELVPGAPLKILRDFRPEAEWLLGPGDMLYLPPGCAHYGVAETECLTYSIGFRAPSKQELVSNFLTYLQDGISLDGMYEDPDLAATDRPGEIPRAMVRKTADIVRRIAWDNDDVTDFLGTYLSEPKPHVFFTPPARALGRERLASAVVEPGIRLALKSRMLYRGGRFYLNGERFDAPKADSATLRELADRRAAKSPHRLDEQTLAQLHEWYKAGFLELSAA